MRVGVAVSQHNDLRLAQRLEALGFDSLWVGGHLLWHGPMLDPLIQLAAYAAATSRIRLGTSVLLLPLYQPVSLAKATATLDIVSGGRLVLGVGVGGENPVEFQAVGVPLAQRGRRADEAIPLLRALWSGAPVRHKGKFFDLPEITMSPVPAQPNGPPVWIAGRSAAALARAAKLGDGWIGIFQSPRRYREAVDVVQAGCVAAGRDPENVTFAHYLWVRIGATYEKAGEGARAYLERSYARAFTSEQTRRFCAFGTADDICARVAGYATAGCRYLIIKIAGTPEEIGEQAEELAAVLLPPAADAQAASLAAGRRAAVQAIHTEDVVGRQEKRG